MGSIIWKKARRRDLQRSFTTEHIQRSVKAAVMILIGTKIFKDAGWFHFTGITPALGPNVAEICKDAVKEAKKRNITVSCDLNFRKNLWTSEQAAETMGELMKYTDVCIANEEDAEKVFGIKADATDINAGKLNRNGYKDVARKLIESLLTLITRRSR